MSKLNFNEPNPETLMQIDWFMQSEKRNRRWEQSGVPDYYCGESGWDWVQENHPDNFRKAWYKAIAHIHQYDFKFEDIENYEGDE